MSSKHFPLLLIIFILLIIGFDQLLKFLAINLLATPFIIIKNWLSFSLVFNQGIAFGIQIPQLILVILNLILIVLMSIFFYQKFNRKSLFTILVLGAFFGGAIGNLVDRLLYGHVVDFISIGTFPVFNLADSCITVSVFLIIAFYDKIRVNKKNKNTKND